MNRKATFAKRQRESDLKDHARQKQERKAARQNAPSNGEKGPQIAWDEAVDTTAASANTDALANAPSLVPTDDTP
jgi:hypothetical protein